MVDPRTPNLLALLCLSVSVIATWIASRAFMDLPQRCFDLEQRRDALYEAQFPVRAGVKHGAGGVQPLCRHLPSHLLPMFVVHHLALRHRQGPLMASLHQAGRNVTPPRPSTVEEAIRAPADGEVRWMTFDRAAITPDIVAQYRTRFGASRAAAPDLRLWSKMRSVSKTGVLRSDSFVPSDPLLALGISHMQALQAIAAGDACEGIVLEDDVTLHPDFSAHLDVYRAQLPSQWAMLALSDTFHAGPAGQLPNQAPWWHVYPRPGTRTADAYLVSKHAALLISSRYRAMSMEIDWHYNMVAEAEELPLFWAAPPIASQNSFNGRTANSWHAG